MPADRAGSRHQAAIATDSSRPAGAVAATRSRRRALSGQWVGLAALTAVVGFLYFWTAATNPDPGGSYHGLLAEAFEDGRTSVSIEPAPELLALPDPYDPAANPPYRLHDASLYQGRYYLYFGPAPAAVLFLPLRSVGVDLSDRWAAPILAFGGFVCAAALLLFLIGRYLPRTPAAWRLVAVAALGTGNVVLFLLRRTAVYETAIGAGYLFLMLAALLLVVGALRERPSLPLIGAGSLALGLAVGSRANMALAAPLLVWAWWRAVGPRSGWRRGPVVRAALAAAGPFVACLALLALYNVVRFGSPTEFGTSYQLAGFNPTQFDFFSLDRLAPGAWFYLLQPPSLGLDFPFIELAPDYPGTLPAGFFVEPVAGVIPVTPLLLFLAAVPVLAWRARERGARELVGLGGLMVAVALALPVISLVSLGGATERYEVDFISLLIIPAAIAWLWLADRLRGAPWPRRAILAMGAAAVAFCALANLAFGVVGYYDGLRTTHPETYERLEATFAWVPTIGATLQGRPVVLEVGPQGVPVATTTLQLAAPGDGVVDLRATFVPNPALPPGSAVALAVTGSDGVSRRVRLTSPEATIRAGLDGPGLHDVRVDWVLARRGGAQAPAPPPAGLSVLEARVTGWTPR